ncbi:GNAT family N-acetyltransferase [Flavobacteriaceae bacterium LMO-SS05]
MITPVISALDIETTAHLAHHIWNQHYVSIIGQQQVDYMLDTFQNAKAIQHQIESGYNYFILYYQKKPCGYLALIPNTRDKNMMISKIYMDSNFRGLNLGSQLLDFTIKETKKRAFNSIWLTVNKNNSKTIQWYQSKGFSIMEELKIDIGQGFVMDDYRMEMPVVY